MPQEHEAIEKATREADADNPLVRRVQVAERAMASACRLFRIQIASLHRDVARARNNWAGVEMEHWTLVLKIKEWESRTGLDHSVLLRGDYHNPYGETDD